MDVNLLVKLALDETKNLELDEVFLVKDLFKGYVWNRIPLNNRLLLGTLFLNEVHQNKWDIEAIEKTSAHQQKYRKVRGGS